MRIGDTRLWIGITLGACASLVLCQLADLPLLAILSKFVASAGFLAVAAMAGAFDSRYGRILFAGLVFSALGDVFLLGATQRLFLLGLASFLLAHVVFVGAFLNWGVNSRWSLAACIPILVIALAVSAWLTPYVPANMLLPVRIYTAVISTMVIVAFGSKGAGGPALIPLGALLFYVSDLFVAAGRFVSPDIPHFIWGLPLYYTGQVLLALSVAAAAASRNR